MASKRKDRPFIDLEDSMSKLRSSSQGSSFDSESISSTSSLTTRKGLAKKFSNSDFSKYKPGLNDPLRVVTKKKKKVSEVPQELEHFGNRLEQTLGDAERVLAEIIVKWNSKLGKPLDAVKFVVNMD
ncbi:hypothetical protein FCV25MIE_09745 [Fagus crenata]